MTKLKSLKLRVYVLIVAVLALGAGAAWKGVKAYQSSNAPKVVAEAGSTVNLYEAPEVQAPEEDPFLDQNLGANTGPDQPNPSCWGGSCVKVVVATAIDASTTIFSIPSPFEKATSTGAGSEVALRVDDGGQRWTAQSTTVDLVNLNITGPATTSYQVACAASATFNAKLPFYNSIVTTSPAFASYIPTSSIGVIENNVTQLQGAMIDSGTVSKIMLGSDKPWLVCSVQATVAGAFTNADNTFTAKGTFRFRALSR